MRAGVLVPVMMVSPKTFSWTPAATSPTLGSELVVNGGFETDASSWTALNGATLTGGTAGGQSGNCLTATRGTAQATGEQAVTVTAGGWYQCSGYLKNGTTTAYLRFQGGRWTFLATGSANWDVYNPVFAASSTSITPRVEAGANGLTGLFDEASVKQVTLSSALASPTNVGYKQGRFSCLPTVAALTAAGLVINLDSTTNPQNYVCAYVQRVDDSTTYVVMCSVSGGTTTVHANVPVAYVAAAKLRIDVSGTEYRVSYNGAQVWAGATISNGSLGTWVAGFDPTGANTLGTITATPSASVVTTSDTPAASNPSLGSELLANNDVEAWGSPTDLTSWTETLAGTSTVNQESSVTHGGSNAVRLDTDGSNSNVSVSQAVTQVAASWYKVTSWLRRGVTSGFSKIQLGGGDLFNADPSTSYTEYPSWARISGANPTLLFGRSTAGNNASYYGDDFSTKAVSLASCHVRIGTTSSKYGVYRCYPTLNNSRSSAGLACCVDDDTNPANEIYAYVNGLLNNVVIVQRLAGVETPTSLATITITNGRELRILVLPGTSGQSNAQVQVWYETSAGALTQQGSTQTINITNMGTQFDAFDPSGLNSLGTMRYEAISGS